SWIRHQLLPALSTRAERDLVPVLARQATVLRAESDYLDDLARRALGTAGDPPAIAVLGALDHDVLRRDVRMVCGSPPVPLAHVDAVVDVVAGRGLAHELPGGRRGPPQPRRPVPDGHVVPPPPGRSGRRPGPRAACASSAMRSRSSPPPGRRCSSACSRARSCSWPTWPGPSTCRSTSTSWPSRPTARPPARAASCGS